jgi:hypothetical protein
MVGICMGPVLVVVTVLGGSSPLTVVVVEITWPLLPGLNVPEDVDDIMVT